MVSDIQKTSHATTLFVTTIILFVLQVMVAPHIQIAEAHPNMLFIAVLLWGYVQGSRSGVIAGFVLGVLFDLLSTTPFGVMALCLSLVGYVSGYRQANVISQSKGSALIGGFAFAFFVELISSIFNSALNGTGSFFHSFLFKMIPGTLYTGLACLIVILIIARVLESSNTTRYKGVRYH